MSSPHRNRIRLDSIVFDAGTQIRAAIDLKVVHEYAEAMTDGAIFPPVIVFADGACRSDGSIYYYMADGFHRGMAAQRIKLLDIDADVRAGTKEDALWFAMGALGEAGRLGLRAKSVDKRHAIELALVTWPSKPATQIADQVGCGHSWVSELRSKMQSSGTGTLPETIVRKNGRSYPASKQHPKTSDIQRLIEGGRSNTEISTSLQVSPSTVSQVRRAMGRGVGPDKTKAAVAERRVRMRDLAAAGNSSAQIASMLGVSVKNCRAILRQEGIAVPADRTVGKLRRHSADRIVSTMVMDAENLTAHVGLIDFAALDESKLSEWISSLNASRRALDSFIRHLQKEQKKHVQAA
jgi:DNA-binding CsgD family transcriptional regulator